MTSQLRNWGQILILRILRHVWNAHRSIQIRSAEPTATTARSSTESIFWELPEAIPPQIACGKVLLGLGRPEAVGALCPSRWSLGAQPNLPARC